MKTTLPDRPLDVSPTKRQKVLSAAMRSGTPQSTHSRRRSASVQSLATIADESTSPKDVASATAPATKSRRVRTGCLTCRERHLKCDEATPDCVNCRKSNRECKRGVRLNFIDIQVKNPPLLPPTPEWSVQFQDESRLIASEYIGGLHRYDILGRRTLTPPQEADVETALNLQRRHHEHKRAVSSMTPMTLSDPSMRASVPPLSYATPNLSHIDGSQSADVSQMHSRQSSTASYFAGALNSHSNGGFGLGIQDSLRIKDDVARTKAHAYRNSDVSVTSLPVTPPIAPAPPPTVGGSTGNLSLDGMVTPPPSETAVSGERAYLNSPEEVYYMQVFVEEVGVWMDSMDKEKHFSRLIPYHSLKSPMLLNAFLACGVKHLTLVNPAYNDDKALFYYDTATTQLLRSLQNPDRNTAECATTAVVLNVYEIMSEKPAARMNHIAGARALIRECGWNAKSTGIGAACFWLNIGMEVLSCLAFNWQTSWDPDQWGVDMDFTPPEGDDDRSVMDDQIGKEEIWVQRIFYIVGKIANFRATIPKFQEASPHDEQIRLGNRLAQWQELKTLCDNWNNACPETMHPFGYLYPSQTNSKSAFPNIWLIKRAAIVGRLFYHTAQCLLAQTHPLEPGRTSEEMRAIQLHHAHQVCGIVAHVKDRGVSSVAIRSLAIASSVLTDPREQDEVLEIMQKITKESGWGLGRVMTELKKAWGRDAGGGPAGEKGVGLAAKFFGPGQASQSPGQNPIPPMQPTQPQQQVPPVQQHMPDHASQHHQQQHYPQRPGPQQRRATHPQPHMQPQQQIHTPPMSGQQHHHLMGTAPGQQTPIVSASGTLVVAPAPMKASINPLSFADFSLPNHPYQNWYEPPSRGATAATSLSQPFF
ncbi:hypothetical protein jhhlp_007740 [Lomentospora prolificans]|uniref:Zn(2)-C6 fungal-type domain-containing protein n=1 Tax=Lomentospora prolificans TaxID=41688 RepID=A0A2N3N0F3_9PEZI|nr:hypothetical protein jhhlp_007740 [Lomentospora prolificans]